MGQKANCSLILSCVFGLAGAVSAKVVVLPHSAVPKVVNASFEDPGNTGDRAAGWERLGQWFNREDAWTPVRTGHCILGYHHWQIPDPKESSVFQDIQGAVDGTEYTFGIHVNLDKTRDTRHDAVSVELRLESTVDGHQKAISSKLYKVADLKPDQWEKLSVTGVPVNDTLRVLVIVTPSPKNGTRGGALRFDDAFLEQTSENASQ